MADSRLAPELLPASGGKRFLNLMIDMISYYLFAIIAGAFIGIALAMTGKPFPERYAQVIGLFLVFAYYLLFEWIFQRSIGKMFTKTKVVRFDGGVPSFGQYALRTLIRFVPFEWVPIMSDAGMPAHDLWTKT